MGLHAPQIIYIALCCLNLGIHLAKHDQPRADKFSFFGALLSNSIAAGLLYWGGFFNN